MARPTQKRREGTGGLYTRRGSDFFYSKILVDGRPVTRSTGSTSQEEAEGIHLLWLADAKRGMLVPGSQKLTVEQVVMEKLTADKNKGSRSYATTEGRWNLHLKPYLGSLKAVNVTEPVMDNYVNHRLGEGAARATINRELALLKTSFKRARKRIGILPDFPMLKEENIRQGFLRDEQYTALAHACAAEGPWTRAMFEVAQSYAWRSGNLKSMRVRGR